MSPECGGQDGVQEVRLVGWLVGCFNHCFRFADQAHAKAATAIYCPGITFLK